MEMEEADELLAYWRRHPPVHVLVANAIGWKPADAPRAAAPIERRVVVPEWGGTEPPASQDGNAKLLALARRRGGVLKPEDLIG